MNLEIMDVLPYVKQLFYPQISPQTVLEIAPDATGAKDILADNGRTYYEIASPYDEGFMGYADVIVCLNVSEQDWDVYVQRIKQSMFPLSLIVIAVPSDIEVRKYFQTFSSVMILLSDGTQFSAAIIGKDDV